MDSANHRSYGVFKPVGHIVVSFPNAVLAKNGHAALRALGVADQDIHDFSDQEMIARIDDDLKQAGALASFGQELNLVKAHRALAEQGYYWLIVRAEGSDKARQMADALRAQGAERAQLYGRFIIEELIEHPDDMPQAKEPAGHGLDAQTRSGLEEERALRRPDGNTGSEPPNPR
ncbi:hypothetical protein [Comamonas sp. NLF-1-9]|uniref:hypothetical protein n=1 Tax=Comamonas sp. NLF-1-9 TaxID=2853163 RepID=UPI001C45A558|nr:hypothetical protein [Comamonas sp. NLF-1-9]QXL85290.1 hypothetical protein KUD94_04780 [Comamonas sp. NLF-1-9]